MKRCLVLLCAFIVALSLAGPANAEVIGTLAGYLNPHDRVQDQLQGKICNDNPALSPTRCTPIPYENFSPLIFQDIEDGVAHLDAFLAAQTQPVEIFAYSLGAIVAYTWIERHMNDPNAPAPGDIDFIVIGNPASTIGGVDTVLNIGAPSPDITGTQWDVIQIRRQYELFTDFPNNPASPYYFFAVINAVSGQYLHDYSHVDPNDPAFVVYQSGNITDKLLPTDLLPMYEWLRWTGPLAMWLDDVTRPNIEDAYIRPVEVPDPSTVTGLTMVDTTATVVTTQEVTSSVTSTVSPTTSLQKTPPRGTTPPKKVRASASAHKTAPSSSSSTTGTTTPKSGSTHKVHTPSAASAKPTSGSQTKKESSASVTTHRSASASTKKANGVARSR